MPSIPSHFCGRSMSRILTLVLAFLCSLTLFSCGLGNGPEKAAKAWFEFTERGEILEADKLVCEEQKDSFREGAFVLSGIYTFAQGFLGTDQPVEIDASDIEYTRVDSLSSADRVVVEVEGEIRMTALGIVDSEELYYLWVMVNEDGQWKWCGTTSWMDEPAVAQEANSADAATDALVENEETNEPEAIDPVTNESPISTNEDSIQELIPARIAFTGADDSGAGLFLLDFEEGIEKTLFNHKFGVRAYGMSWSPETQRLLFSILVKSSDGSLYAPLYSMGLDDDQPVELTIPGQDAFQFAWTDGGKKVRYMTRIQKGEEGLNQFFIDGVVFVDADGSNRRTVELPTFSRDQGNWRWSDDGNTAYFIDFLSEPGHLRVYSVDKEGGNPQELVNVSFFPHIGSLDNLQFLSPHFIMSPNGSQLAFFPWLYSRDLPLILILDLASGKLTEIEQSDSEVIDPITWTPDGSKLIAQIFKYDLVTEPILVGLSLVDPVTSERIDLIGEGLDLDGRYFNLHECSFSPNRDRALLYGAWVWVVDISAQSDPVNLSEILGFNVVDPGAMCWIP